MRKRVDFFSFISYNENIDKGVLISKEIINGEQWGKNGNEYFHLGYTERI